MWAAPPPHSTSVYCRDTDPLYVAVKAKDVEDAVGVHLDGLQAVQHDNWRLGMAAVLAGGRGRGPVARPVASAAAPSHWWTHAATLVGRGTVALIVAMVAAA